MTTMRSGSAAQPAARARRSRTSFKLGYSALDPALLPERIAVEEGLFEKYGVDVELIEFDGDTKTAQALQSGAIDSMSAGGTVALSSGRDAAAQRRRRDDALRADGHARRHVGDQDGR